MSESLVILHRKALLEPSTPQKLTSELLVHPIILHQNAFKNQVYRKILHRNDYTET